MSLESDMKNNSELKTLSNIKNLSVLTLLTSSGTILCCALPVLLVTIGAGAALSSLISTFPQIVWVSKYKEYIFTVAFILIILSGYFQWHSRKLPCPANKLLAAQCLRARKLSLVIYFVSVVILTIGFTFAFILPYLMNYL
ncbi:MAG: hypothetical protein O2849_06675 [Proteobacteria bacterium]|nr:hypothetical protein [Pseudomonadota bacterium]